QNIRLCFHASTPPRVSMQRLSPSFSHHPDVIPEPSMSDHSNTSRRSFLKTSSAALAGPALVGSLAKGAYAAGSDEIKFGLIGCGGRGTGAAGNIFNTKGNVKLTAVADAFRHKADDCVSRLLKVDADKVDVPGDRIFAGLDAYKQVIDS